MPNPLSRYLQDTFIKPRVDRQVTEQVEDIRRSTRAVAYGVVPYKEVSLRDSIGQPHETDHALLYSVYRKHVDVNACVKKWVAGIIAPGWRITHMDPNAEQSDAFISLVDDTTTWLRNPNPDKPFSILLAEVVQNLGISGDAFWNVTRDQKGKPLEIWPVHPSQMRVIADQSGVIGYVQLANGERIPFDRKEIIHPRLPNPTNDLYGESPMEAPLEDIGLDLQAMVSNRALFANGFKPSAIAILDKDLAWESQKEAAEILKEKHVGEGKQHQLVTMAGVSDIKSWMHSLKDMEFTALRELSTAKVARAYDIPPVLLGNHNAGDYATSRVLERQTYETCYRPKQQYLEQIITEHLLHSIDPDLRFEFNQPDFSDPDTRTATFIDARTQAKAITRNELRTQLGLEEIDGMDDSDDLLNATKPVDVDDENTKPESQQVGNTSDEPNPDAPEELDVDDNPKQKSITKAVEAGDDDTLADEREAEMEELAMAILPAVAQYFAAQEADYLDRLPGDLTTQKVPGYVNANAAEHDTMLHMLLFGLLVASLTSGSEAAQLQIGITLDFNQTNPAVQEYLSENALQHAKGINQTTREAIKRELMEGVKAGESTKKLAARVQSVFTDAKGYRATLIARSETAQAYAYANYSALKEAGATHRTWKTAGDDRVCFICRPLNNVTVPIDKKYPGGYEPTECHVLCRCTEVGLTLEDDE